MPIDREMHHKINYLSFSHGEIKSFAIDLEIDRRMPIYGVYRPKTHFKVSSSTDLVLDNWNVEITAILNWFAVPEL